MNGPSQPPPLDICPHCKKQGQLYPTEDGAACRICGWRGYDNRAQDHIRYQEFPPRLSRYQ